MSDFPDFPDLKLVFAVAAGGAIGTLTRFLAGHYMSALFGTTFPWATLTVNIIGCLVVGFIGTIAMQKPGTIDPVLRLLLTTGFSGGLTTFSTFAFETVALFERADISLAFANIGANLVIGLIAVYLGTILARAI